MAFSTPDVNKLAILAATLSGAAIPVSTAGQNIGAALLLLVFLLSTPSWQKSRNFFLQPFALMGVMLGVYMALGTLWTSSDAEAAWRFFWKMRAYYIIPLLLFIFSKDFLRNYVLVSFGILGLIVVLLSCISAAFDYPIYKGLPGDWFIFKTHTYHNFYTALMASGLLSIVLTQRLTSAQSYILFTLIAIAGFDILFLVTGRTGQIAFLCMLSLILLMWNWRRGFAMLVGILLILAVIVPRFSPSFEDGVANAESDMRAYTSGNANTPIGMRLAWHKASTQLILESPVFGHGTGSFKTEYKKLPASELHAPLSDNPHNDYLLLSVELGIPGGLLLIGLLVAAAWQGRHLLLPWKLTLYSLLFGMGISTLANSFFTDNTTGLAFVVLSCALLSGPKDRDSSL
ncbi:MAG: O-antigen ligase family protein [Rhodoferax sp.]|jgi:O-antigen ligase|uniref:O-antigen ligase family protein n=1 Tax=Rhodoferax sp. TaxID=50421 RepID=UPI001B455B30|nr:O-antigen ligase family protein [Rhodoferax sp.]MBP9737081.1 O-antigen ligase family protein [Rhodoferax sp.]